MKAVFRVACLVIRENLQGRIDGAGGLRLVLTALSHTSSLHVMRNAGFSFAHAQVIQAGNIRAGFNAA